LPRIFIGGGQDYWGETAERDKHVIEGVAVHLFNQLGNSVEIVTGGMQGIPNDFAVAWTRVGGRHVLCVVSSEHEEAFLQTKPCAFKHIILGETQTQRRLSLTKLERIKCALFIQGGKFSTHEMQLFEERQIPIVTHWGSGGAAGGGQPYEGYAYSKMPQSPVLQSTDPSLNPIDIALAIAYEIRKILDTDADQACGCEGKRKNERRCHRCQGLCCDGCICYSISSSLGPFVCHACCTKEECPDK